MASFFTVNANLEEPANGDYVDTWNIPLNSNFSILDSKFGTSAVIDVTGLSGPIPLTEQQIQSANLFFAGNMAGDVIYTVPTGVGGFWSIVNATTNAHTLYINVIGAVRIAVETAAGSGMYYSDGTAFHSSILAQLTDASVANAAVAAFATTIPTTFNTVSTYAAATTATANIAPGTSVAGSSLTVFQTNSATTSTLTGTWKYMGSSTNGASGMLWVRTA